MKNIKYIPLIICATLFLALLLIVHLGLSFTITIAQMLWLPSVAKFFDECDVELSMVYKSVISFVDLKVMGK